MYLLIKTTHILLFIISQKQPTYQINEQEVKVVIFCVVFFLLRCDAPDVRSINATKQRLSTKNQFFEEYILEDSGKDDNMYFNRKVAGFMVEGNGESVVWFSQEVWLLCFYLALSYPTI